MFKKKIQKAIFVLVIVILIVGTILPFFTKLWK